MQHISGDILENLRVRISDSWETSTPKKFFEILFKLKTSKNDHSRGGQIYKCPCLQVNVPIYFPKMPFYSLNCPFYFPELSCIFQKCPFVSWNCPFVLQKHLFISQKCPIVFQNYLQFSRSAFVLFTMRTFFQEYFFSS